MFWIWHLLFSFYKAAFSETIQSKFGPKYAMPHIISCDTKVSKLVLMYVKEIYWSKRDDSKNVRASSNSTFLPVYIQY